MQLLSFDLTAAPIAEAKLDQLHALSIGVSWPHRPDDWLMLLEFGRGVVALDEIGRVAGSAMWFPWSEDFATVGMVITAPRMQARGTAGWLMDHVLREAGSCAIGLNATHPAYRLYRTLGFEPEAIVYQCQGEALLPSDLPPPAEGLVRPIREPDLDALLRLDAEAFGAPRRRLLARMMEVGSGYALVRDGSIDAFAFSRPFGRGQVVGPVVARSDEDAIAVTAPHVAAHTGRFLRIDTRQEQGAFATFVQRCNLAVFDTVTTMSLGRRWLRPGEGRAQTFGLASHTFG